MKKKMKEQVANSDSIVAHTSDNKIITWKMGALKQAFLNKELPYEVTFVYHIRSNKNYKVTYSATKGFKFTEHDPYDVSPKQIMSNKN